MSRKKPGKGHNINEVVDASKLRPFVERIEKLNEDIGGLQEDRKEVYAEAKDAGLDVPALRSAIRKRASDQDKLRQHEELVDLYLGALSGTPLAEAARAAGNA